MALGALYLNLFDNSFLKSTSPSLSSIGLSGAEAVEATAWGNLPFGAHGCGWGLLEGAADWLVNEKNVI